MPNNKYSKNDSKITVRVPKEWHQLVKDEASKQGLNLGKFIMTVVDEWFINKEVNKEVDKEVDDIDFK